MTEREKYDRATDLLAQAKAGVDDAIAAIIEAWKSEVTVRTHRLSDASGLIRRAQKKLEKEIGKRLDTRSIEETVRSAAERRIQNELALERTRQQREDLPL